MFKQSLTPLVWTALLSAWLLTTACHFPPAPPPRRVHEAPPALETKVSKADRVAQELARLKRRMGEDVRSPKQIAAALDIINLLADERRPKELGAFLERTKTMTGVRQSIAWFNNQVILRGDVAANARAFKTALAIYQSVPSRSEILEVQAAALAQQREDLRALEDTPGTEKNKPDAHPPRSAKSIKGLKAYIDDNERALAVFQKKEDFDAAILMRTGRCLYHLKRWQEALTCFSTLRIKYPTFKENKTAAYAEICILDTLKKSTGLLALCKSYLANYPDCEDAEAVATLAGELLVQEGKWSDVAPYYADLETRFPKSKNMDRFIFYQGLAHFIDADFALSAPLFEKVLKDFPKSRLYEATLYHLAMTCFLNNDYKKTLAACKEFLAKFPKGPFAGDMRYRLSFVDTNDARVKPEKIIEDLESFLKAHPDDVSNGSMLCLLADTYKKKHDDDKALAAYKRAVRTKSPDDVIQYALDSATVILQGRKDWNGIAELHGEFLKEHSNKQLAVLAAGQVAKMKIRLGKGEEGAEILADSLRKSIGNPAIEHVESLLDDIVKALVPRIRPSKEEIDAVAAQLDKQLLETLTKAAGKEPSPTASARIAYARARLSQLLYKTSRTERSDLLLKGIVEKYSGDPSVLSPTLLSVCGDILLNDGNPDRAEAMYKRLADRYRDGLFSDAGPLGLGKVALARKDPDAALRIFDNNLANNKGNNKGNSRFRENTLGKLQALIDLGKYDDARKLAKDLIVDKTFRGEWAGKAYLMLAQSYRAESAKNPPGDAATDLLKMAYSIHQRIFLTYQSQPDVCAEAYWQAYEIANELHEDALAAEVLQALANHPKLQNTRRAKDAKRLTDS